MFYSSPAPHLILSWWGLSVSITIFNSSDISSLCASNITTIKSALLNKKKQRQHVGNKQSAQGPSIFTLQAASLH